MSFERIWLAGCGNMAGAMLEGWLRAGSGAERFLAIRPSGAAVAGGVRVVTGPPADAPAPDLLLLGFKPQQLGDAAPAYAPHAGADTTVLSILAGVEIATLRAAFPHAGAIVRAMPNLPVRLGQGVTGLAAEGGARPEHITALLEPLGLAEWVDGENRLDALSALAGSGPAFVYRFIDALARGGEALGLAPAQAARLALATVRGAGALAAASPHAPSGLADRVASKGGSTRAGLDVLDEDGALDALAARTLRAARARVAQMAAEARGNRPVQPLVPSHEGEPFVSGNNPTFGQGGLDTEQGESTDQFGANTGREKVYPLNIGAGQAGTKGATGQAPVDGSGAGKASGGEEVVGGKSGIQGEQSG